MQEVPRPRRKDAQEGVEAVRGEALWWLILAMLCAAAVVRLSR